jgi:SAM-dependent methyltransferase
MPARCGCGTGELLRLAREGGHAGRLVGLDPAPAMLDVAGQRRDVEWFLGDLNSATWQQEFDVIVMTGHAFQLFLTDDELRVALAAIRSALKQEGRFVFETRHPPFRGWRDDSNYTSPNEVEHEGVRVRVEVRTERVEGEYVTFTSTYTSASWPQPIVSQSTLRFLDNPADTLPQRSGARH